MTWLVIDARNHMLLTFGKDEKEMDDFMQKYQNNFDRPTFKTPLMIGIEINDFDLTGVEQKLTALEEKKSSEL